MNDAEIDEVILAVTPASWRKVAMIISKSATKLVTKLPEGQDGQVLIARRIKALVLNGRLAAQGDVEKWRNSEIRLP